jgi:hypothetical protein
MFVATADILSGVSATLLDGLCNEQGTHQCEHEHIDLLGDRKNGDKKTQENAHFSKTPRFGGLDIAQPGVRGSLPALACRPQGYGRAEASQDRDSSHELTSQMLGLYRIGLEELHQFGSICSAEHPIFCFGDLA